MENLEWQDRENGGGSILDNGEGKVFLSYQPNDTVRGFGDSILDSANPETAIVLDGDKKSDPDDLPESLRKRYPDGKLPRFLIYRGDWREELEPLYPDIEALKAHWREHGGHFWSDDLDD